LNQRLLRQAQPAQMALLLTISLGTLTGGVIVSQAFFLSRVINRVFLEGHTLSQVQHLLLIMFGLSLARAVLTWLGQITAQRVSSTVKNALRQQLAAHLLALGPAYTRASAAAN
jgi:ATP-binding cassette subfamily C protein CydD